MRDRQKGGENAENRQVSNEPNALFFRRRLKHATVKFIPQLTITIFDRFELPLSSFRRHEILF